MRVNYFLSVLGETLQRRDDETAKYSMALPDLEQCPLRGIPAQVECLTPAESSRKGLCIGSILPRPATCSFFFLFHTKKDPPPSL